MSDVSDIDRDFAIRTMLGEEGSFAGQAGVAAVILNRLAQGDYGENIRQVVLAPYQFEPWSTRADELMRVNPNDQAYQRAAEIFDAVNEGVINDPTGGATHFYAPEAQRALGRAAPSWASGAGKSLGKTMFYAPNGPVERQFEDDTASSPQKPQSKLADWMASPAKEPARADWMAAPSATKSETLHDRPPVVGASQTDNPTAFLPTAISSLKRAVTEGPDIVKDALTENVGQAFKTGQENVAAGVAGMKAGGKDFVPGLVSDVEGTVQEAVSPITGAVNAAMELAGRGDPMMAGVETPHVFGKIEELQPGEAVNKVPDAASTLQEAFHGVEIKPAANENRADWMKGGEVIDGNSLRSDAQSRPVGTSPAVKGGAVEKPDWMAEEPKPQSVGAAATPPTAPLPETPTRQTINEQADRFFRIRNAAQADRAELLQSVDRMPQELRNPQIQERLYHFMEDPSFPLSPEERKLYDDYVAPFKREERDRFEEVKKTNLPFEDFDPSYAHRIVKGRAPQFDRVLGEEPDPISGIGRSLPQSTSSMKERVFFTIQSDTGDRRLVARNDDGQLVLVQKGQPGQPLAAKGDLKVGDAFKYDNHLWMLEHARTPEIEANTDLRYYKNALANTIDNIVRLRAVSRSIFEFERLKASPEWATYARPVGAKDIPRDWVEPKMPLFRGWRVEPRFAEAIDDFYGGRGSIMDKLARMNRFALGTMFWSPFVHLFNEGAHWFVGRSWDWVTPSGVKSLAQDGARAMFEVVTQGPKYRELLKEGSSLLYSGVANQDFYYQMMKKLGEDIQRNPAKWDFIAKTLGVSPVTLASAWYRGVSSVLWAGSDMMMMQRVLENERKGMTTRQAIAEAERHIPNYRIPTRIGTEGDIGRLMSRALQNPNLTEFGRYRYGMMKSWATLVRDLVKGGKTPLNESRRLEAAGNIMATALLMFGLFPAANYLSQKAFGPGAAFIPRGPGTLASPFVDKAFSTKWAKDHLPKWLTDYYNGDHDLVMMLGNIVSPSPVIKGALEMAPFAGFRNLFTGQSTIEPADIRSGRVNRVVGQAVDYFAQGALQPYYAIERAREKKQSVAKGLAEQALGVSEPNRAGRSKVYNRQEKEANKRANTTVSPIERLLMGELPWR